MVTLRFHPIEATGLYRELILAPGMTHRVCVTKSAPGMHTRGARRRRACSNDHRGDKHRHLFLDKLVYQQILLMTRRWPSPS